MSHILRDTPRPFQPAITQRDIETEVAHCIGGVTAEPWGVPRSRCCKVPSGSCSGACTITRGITQKCRHKSAATPMHQAWLSPPDLRRSGWFLTESTSTTRLTVKTRPEERKHLSVVLVG